MRTLLTPIAILTASVACLLAQETREIQGRLCRILEADSQGGRQATTQGVRGTRRDGASASRCRTICRSSICARCHQVGDHLRSTARHLRRFKGKIEEPDKNLKIVVKDFKQIDGKNYRIVVDVDATILVHGEAQQWQKGLFLIGGEAYADANVTAAIVCDVGVSLKPEEVSA